jgi:hypothetical protein
MNLAEMLIKIIEDSTKLKPEQRIYARMQLKDAILNNRLILIKNNEGFKGFLTYLTTDTGTFINNLFILKEFRNKNNLIYLRKILKNLFDKNKIIYWKNHKKNLDVKFKNEVLNEANR